MSDFNKSIDLIVSRFASVSYLGTTGNSGVATTTALEGNSAIDKLSDYFDYYPQNLEILEKLMPKLCKNVPNSTKRTLQLFENTKAYKNTLMPNVLFIGNPEYADAEWLVIVLTLPASTATDKKTKVAEWLAAFKPVADFINKFSKEQGDFGGVIAVEINQCPTTTKTQH